MENVEVIPLAPADALTITILVDNLTDVFMPDLGPAHRFSLAASDRRPSVTFEEGEVIAQLRGEHGFSALLTVTRAERTHRILFDMGVSPNGLMTNMRMLDFSPGDVEAIVCSHGHFDHTAGLDGFSRAVGRSNIPVLIHPDFWNKRRIILPGREPLDLPTTSQSALQGVGFEIIENRRPSFLLDGSVLVTGEVDRTNDFEVGFPLQQALRAGSWEPDPLVLDDQGVVINVRDKGLVVLTGCGHAGIVNTVRHAQRLTGEDRIHAIVGGFHLNGPLFEPLIPAVLAAFAEFEPDVIVPTHCTGWRANHRLAAAFPDAYVPSCVGTRLEL